MNTNGRFLCMLLFGSFVLKHCCGELVMEGEGERKRVKIFEVTYEEEEPGSGDEEPLPECTLSYKKYKGHYLKGVKEPNHHVYNGTTFEDCERLCCYETRFECKSFSYFRPIKVCWIMNVTKDYMKVHLLPVRSWVHAERVENRGDETTAVPKSRISTTTEPLKRRTSPTSRNENTAKSDSPKSALVEGPPNSEKRIDENQCGKRCLHGGFCERKIIVEDGTQRTQQVCVCEEGWEGSNCENEVESKKGEEGGVPVWLIVVIVLGSIILLLFLAVFIIYQIYRRKTGEYRVVKQIQKWTRRGKKKKATSSAEDFANPEATHTSPTTSVQSMHGSVTSSTTHSTTTSV